MSLMWFGLNPGLVIFRHSNPAVTQLVLLMDKNPAGDRANSAVSGRRESTRPPQEGCNKVRETHVSTTSDPKDMMCLSVSMFF